MSSRHDPVPTCLPLRCSPEARRARLIVARKYPVRSATRRAIIRGHWDGGSILAEYGLPMRLPEGTNGQPCEALREPDDASEQVGS
jgi:hypothetical protein